LIPAAVAIDFFSFRSCGFVPLLRIQATANG
jgi:hypothetical protein